MKTSQSRLHRQLMWLMALLVAVLVGLLVASVAQADELALDGGFNLDKIHVEAMGVCISITDGMTHPCAVASREGEQDALYVLILEPPDGQKYKIIEVLRHEKKGNSQTSLWKRTAPTPPLSPKPSRFEF